jgi:hypothetical protein
MISDLDKELQDIQDQYSGLPEEIRTENEVKEIQKLIENISVIARDESLNLGDLKDELKYDFQGFIESFVKGQSSTLLESKISAASVEPLGVKEEDLWGTFSEIE